MATSSGISSGTSTSSVSGMTQHSAQLLRAAKPSATSEKGY